MKIEVKKTGERIRHVTVIINEREYQISENEVTNHLSIMKTDGNETALCIYPKVSNVIDIK